MTKLPMTRPDGSPFVRKPAITIVDEMSQRYSDYVQEFSFLNPEHYPSRKSRHKAAPVRRSPPGAALVELAKALDWKCGICGIEMTKGDVTKDHVVSRGKGGGNYGNLIAAHSRCNNAKGDRDPTGCELICLEATNAALGVDLSCVSRG